MAPEKETVSPLEHGSTTFGIEAPNNHVDPFPSTMKKRNLRTYGKRKASDRGVEPPAKRLKIPGPEPDPDSREQESPVFPTPLPSEPSPKRSGILRYFKPAPSRSSSIQPNPSSDAVEPLSTPPSSPVSATRKRRRRLTTRPFDELTGLNTPEPSSEETSRRSSTAEIPSVAHSPASDTGKSSVGSLSPDHANRPKTQRRLSGIARGKSGARAGTKSPSIQMTLSLTSQGAFTECAVCNMLYNPQNEIDIKYHARRHAVACRKLAER